MTPAEVITEQIHHLRKLAAFFASKAMGGERASLESLFDTQARLLDLTHYQAGYQTTETGSIEAPAPVFGIATPPPLQPYDEDVLMRETDEARQRTAVSFPPDPFFGPEDLPRQEDRYEEER